MSGAASYRLGVDVGGTHTDLVLLDAATGRILIEKVPSTPANPAAAVLDGLARFVGRGVAPEEIGFFAHGTTITTNALLEMRGARVGMLITEGFRAVQEVQTQARDGNPFDYFFRRPDPIAPQSLTRGDSGQDRLRRHRAPAARRGNGQGSGAVVARGGGRIHRRLLPVFVHEPGP